MNRPVATKRYSDSLKPGEEVLLGFDGWKNDAYTISINNNTKVQKAEIPVSPENKEITVDLYADWKIANVVFMKQGGTGDGRTLGQELGSWNDAINKLNENSITKIGELCTQGKTELKNMGISMNDANKIEIELELMGLKLKN